jgi:hypothetical protein
MVWVALVQHMQGVKEYSFFTNAEKGSEASRCFFIICLLHQLGFYNVSINTRTF